MCGADVLVAQSTSLHALQFTLSVLAWISSQEIYCISNRCIYRKVFMVFMSESTDDVIIGPILPPDYNQSVSDNEENPSDLSDNSKDVADEIASVAAVKKDFRRDEETSNKIIGPVLPDDWKSGNSNPESLQNEVYGPALPPGFKKEVITEDNSGTEDDDDDIVGPRPSEATVCSSNYDVLSDIERRAKKMKDHLEGKDKQNVTATTREEWMVQLPDALGHKIGLVSRTFLQKDVMKRDEDRSAWTDTPADMERKAKEKQSKKLPTPDLKEYARQEQDKRMHEQMEEYNKTNRSESLLEMHQKNRKRKMIKSPLKMWYVVPRNVRRKTQLQRSVVHLTVILTFLHPTLILLRQNLFWTKQSF